MMSILHIRGDRLGQITRREEVVKSDENITKKYLVVGK